MAKRADERQRKQFIIVSSGRTSKDRSIDFNLVVDAMMSDPELMRELDEKIARAVQSHAQSRRRQTTSKNGLPFFSRRRRS